MAATGTGAANFVGGAAEATLQGDVTSTSTSFTFGSGQLAAWPTANFEWRLESEKIFATSRSGDTITCTLANRGQDGTTAAAHLAGAKARHVGFSRNLQQINDLINLPTTAGDTVYASAAGVWQRLGIGTARQNLQTNAAGTAPTWVPSPASTLTGTGDLLVSSAPNTIARLAVGTANQALLGGTTPTWGAVPFGTLGYAQVTSNGSGIGNTITDLSGLSVAVTVGAGRRIRVTGHVLIGQTTADGLSELMIREGSTTLTEAQAWILSGKFQTMTVQAVLTPSTGSHTYKLSYFDGAGTGTVTASASLVSFILVEDIGT